MILGRPMWLFSARPGAVRASIDCLCPPRIPRFGSARQTPESSHHASSVLWTRTFIRTPLSPCCGRLVTIPGTKRRWTCRLRQTADRVGPDQKNVTWRKELPGLGWSSPVVANGPRLLTTAVPGDAEGGLLPAGHLPGCQYGRCDLERRGFQAGFIGPADPGQEQPRQPNADRGWRRSLRSLRPHGNGPSEYKGRQQEVEAAVAASTGRSTATADRRSWPPTS